jgi:hypothetical protein
MNQPNIRFAAGDAVYTEGITTNAGTLGMDQPLASATFYRKCHEIFWNLQKIHILF